MNYRIIDINSPSLKKTKLVLWILLKQRINVSTSNTYTLISIILVISAKPKKRVTFTES